MVVSLRQLTMLGNFKILGFKVSRYRLWWKVLKEEKARLSLSDWWSLVLLALKGIIKREKGVGFSGKMKKCARCVIYDCEAKKCRPYDGSDLGCGCFMPFKIALGGGCWADENQIEEECVGWKANKK